MNLVLEAADAIVRCRTVGVPLLRAEESLESMKEGLQRGEGEAMEEGEPRASPQ